MCQQGSFGMRATPLCLTAWPLGDRGPLGEYLQKSTRTIKLGMVVHACVPRDWGQPWLHEEFQLILSYRVRLYLNNPPTCPKIKEVSILHVLGSTYPLADTVIGIITMSHRVLPPTFSSLCDAPAHLI